MDFGFDANTHQWVMSGAPDPPPTDDFTVSLVWNWARTRGLMDAVLLIDLRQTYYSSSQTMLAKDVSAMLDLLVPGIVDSDLENRARADIATRDPNERVTDLWNELGGEIATAIEPRYFEYWKAFRAELDEYRKYWNNQAAAQGAAIAQAATGHISSDMVIDSAQQLLSGRFGYVSTEGGFYVFPENYLPNFLAGTHRQAAQYARENYGAFDRSDRTGIPADTIGVIDVGNGLVTAVYPQQPMVVPPPRLDDIDWLGEVREANSNHLDGISRRKATFTDVDLLFGMERLVLGTQPEPVRTLKAAAGFRQTKLMTGTVRFKYKKIGPCEFVLEIADAGDQEAAVALEHLRDDVKLMLKSGNWEYLSQPKVNRG